MENREKNPENKEREKNELDYHAWLGDIYREIRNIHFKSSCCYHANVLKIMDKFIEVFRIYLRKNSPDKSRRMHDYYLARATSRLMLLFRDLIIEENDHEYLLKICELLGGCTVLWLRYLSFGDIESGEAQIESILNSYAFYLQSTTDESFLLKIFAHVLFANKKLPGIFSKILEKFLKMRVQRKGRRDQEVKDDQLYILYIIAFKLWEILRCQGDIGVGDIPKYANDFMKPMISILSNHRYAPYLPAITPNDIEQGKATRIVLKKLQSRYLQKLAEAAVKEDWLKGSDINTPITVDLSIEDDVNKNELLEMNQVNSVNREVENLSINEKNGRLSKELWWVEILQKRALKNFKNAADNYKVVEVIEIDDKEDEEIEANDNALETQEETELETGNVNANTMQAEIVNKEESIKMHEKELTVTGRKENNSEILSDITDRVGLKELEGETSKTSDEFMGSSKIYSNQEETYKNTHVKQRENKNRLIDGITRNLDRCILNQKENKNISNDTITPSKSDNQKEMHTSTTILDNSEEAELERCNADEMQKEIANKPEKNKINEKQVAIPIESNSEILNKSSDRVPKVSPTKINEKVENDKNFKELQEMFNGREELLVELDEDFATEEENRETQKVTGNKDNKKVIGKKSTKNLIGETTEVARGEDKGTSRQISDEIISVFEPVSKELNRHISTQHQEHNEECGKSNLPTKEQDSEILEISSKLNTVDDQQLVNNRVDVADGIGKSIEEFNPDKEMNVVVSSPRNINTTITNSFIDFQEDSSEDEESISIICIEDTKPKTPLIFTDENESETLSQIKVLPKENIIQTDLNIDKVISPTSVSKSAKIVDMNVKELQNKPKEINNSNENISFKNKDAENKKVKEKEFGRNATTERAEDETSIPPTFDDDDKSSISSIIESETYDNADLKIDDIHIEKIKPIEITETENSEKSTQENSIFSIATNKKLPPPSALIEKLHQEPAQSHRVVFSTSTINARRNKSTSSDFSFSPEQFQSIHGEIDEIKSPLVERFSKSDTDEFKKLFNNTYKDSLQNDEESCEDEEDSMVHSAFLNSPTNMISKRTNEVVPKRSILCKRENISTSVKRKAVSFAPIAHHKKSPLMANRSVNFDSTIIERKTYDSPLTLGSEQQSWKSSINTSSNSNQHEQSSNEQEHELDNILSTNDINCFGSPSPSLIKDSGNKASTSSAYCRVVKKPVSNKLFEYGFWNGRKIPPPGKMKPLNNGQQKIFLNGTINNQIKKKNKKTHLDWAEEIPLKDMKNTLPHGKSSLIKETETSPRPKIDFEALKRISSIHKTLGDFDRYLLEKKRNESNPIQSTTKVKKINLQINLQKDQNEVKKSSENEMKLIQSFNDPQLKKKAIVQLVMLKINKQTVQQQMKHNNNNNSEKNIDHCNKHPVPESLLPVVHNCQNIKDFQNKTTTTHGNIETDPIDKNSVNIIKNQNKITSAPQFRLPSKPKREENLTKMFEQNTSTFLKDKSSNVFGLKSSVLVRKRRSSVDSEIVVRVFTDKNKKRSTSGSSNQPNPVVLLKRMKTEHFNHKNKKIKKKNREHSSEKRILDELPDYVHIESFTEDNKKSKQFGEKLVKVNGRRRDKLRSRSKSAENLVGEISSSSPISTNTNIESWTNRSKQNIKIIDKIISPFNNSTYSKLELSRSENNSKSDVFLDSVKDKMNSTEVYHPRIVALNSTANKPSELTKKFGSLNSSTDEKTNDTTKSNCISRLEGIEFNSVNLGKISDKFSVTQSCSMFVPEKEFNSIPAEENTSEHESPLLILSDPSDGLLISEQSPEVQSKRRKTMFKNNNSCCSSDTSDLAIFPKRRKMLDSLKSNSEESGNAIISVTETLTGSIKRKQCTQESEEKIAHIESDLPIIENNSLNSNISGTESPEINVNMEIAKTYSKNNLVQNVFVPPELEMNFEDVSKISKMHCIRKGLSKSSAVV